MRIQVSQAHRLGRIGVQLRVAPQRLGHTFVLIESDRRQGPEQPSGKAGSLFLRQAQRLSGDLLNAHTNRRLMPDLRPVQRPTPRCGFRAGFLYLVGYLRPFLPQSDCAAFTTISALSSWVINPSLTNSWLTCAIADTYCP